MLRVRAGIGKGFGLFVECELVEERKVKPFTIEDFHEAAKKVEEWRKRTWPDLFDGEKVKDEEGLLGRMADLSPSD